MNSKCLGCGGGVAEHAIFCARCDAHRRGKDVETQAVAPEYLAKATRAANSGWGSGVTDATAQALVEAIKELNGNVFMLTRAVKDLEALTRHLR